MGYTFLFGHSNVFFYYVDDPERLSRMSGGESLPEPTHSHPRAKSSLLTF